MIDITTNETPNTRLLKLIYDDLHSSDTAIAKAIADVKGISISKTNVATHLSNAGNKKIKQEFIENIGETLPFLNTSWLVDGKGQMLKDWSSKEQSDFILTSSWYKDKSKKSEEFNEQNVMSILPKMRKLLEETAR